MSKRLLVRDQRGERERLLVGTMTVGRDTRCDISDSDPLLSRRHAEFVCRPDSLVVRDLNSRNGISVNGVKVQEAVLRPGDVVKVARLVMTYLGDLESARAAPPRPVAADERARAGEDSAARFDAARTEKIVRATGAGSGAPVPDPQDDRTNVVPRRDAQYTAPPQQVAVARMTPPAQLANAPTRPAPIASAPRPSELPEADSDSTRPMIRDSEIKTATPVLPLSAQSASGAVSGGRVAPPPVPPPPADDPLEDWSLELRPPQPDRSPPRPEAPPRVAAPRAEPARGAATTSSPATVRVLAGSLTLAVVAFVLGALPLLVWRGRFAETYDRLLIVPTALTPGTTIVVFGPPLLVALGAGIVLAWWLRRG